MTKTARGKKFLEPSKEKRSPEKFSLVKGRDPPGDAII